MRRLLLVLLGFGVFAGYGSAIASARWHARHHGGCDERWGRSGKYDRWQHAEAPVPPAPQAAPAPVLVSPPPAAAPAPQVFVISVPGATPVAPQVISVPVPAAAAPTTPTP
jgi:hypothetical protein